jgi:hypothetical protein
LRIAERRIPVRHLDANENAENDDQEGDRDRGPLLLPEMDDDAAEDHRSVVIAALHSAGNASASTEVVRAQDSSGSH